MRDSQSTYTRTEKKESLSLRDLAAPLFRRRKLTLGVFVGVFVLASLAGIYYFCTRYRSGMEVLVGQARRETPVTTDSTAVGPATPAPLTDEEVNSESELLQSGDVLRKVVLDNGLQKLGLYDKLPWVTEADRIDHATRKLAKDLDVETVDKTNLVGIKYPCRDPELCYSVLNSLANHYMSAHIAAQRASGSLQFFDKQTRQYKVNLDQSEDALKALGKEKNVASPGDERDDLALQVSNFVGLVHTTEQAIAADEKRMASDKEQMESTPQRSPTEQVTASVAVLLQQLQPALLEAQSKRSQLLLKYDPSYPLVQEADRQVALAQAAVDQAEQKKFESQTTDRDPTYELLREDFAKTQSDLAAQKASLVSLRSGVNNMQAQMVDLDEKSIIQGDIRREMKANEGNYLLYLNKREQERASAALDQTRITDVSIAIPPNLPVLPIFSYGLVLLGAFVVSLVISFGAAYTVDYFDPSFQTSAQVAETLGVPIVVAISKKTA